MIRHGCDINPEEAPHLAALARGSVARAITLAQAGILETRRWTLELLTSSPVNQQEQLSREVLGKPRSWDGARVRQVAEVLMTWYRDVLTVRHGLDESRLANVDHIAILRREADQLDDAELGRRVRLLEELIQAVEHQVTPPMALFTTLTEFTAGLAPSTR